MIDSIISMSSPNACLGQVGDPEYKPNLGFPLTLKGCFAEACGNDNPKGYFKKTQLRFFCFFIFAIIVLLLAPASHLYAGDSPVSTVLETSKALVDIQSINATVMAGKPRGFIDKATGQILITRKVRPISATRSGSGVIIDPRGIIVTNAHTIRGAGGLAVTLFNGTRAPVKDVYLVPKTDLAFLSIDPPFALSSVRLADPDTVAKGTNVYTIGHSEWLKGTVLGGKLLGVQRGKIAGASQVTALRLNFDMEKGDSGCPVLDARGELLGIIGAGTVGQGNITIAIPSNAIAAAYKEYSFREEQRGQAGLNLERG